MKKVEYQKLCLIFLFVFCFLLNSCKIPENILQSSSEVDFSTPQKVQISYNENIYDTVIALNNSKLEVNFINEKDLLDGAYVCLTENSYRITYNDMVFNGEKSELTTAFLPCVIYNFVFTFDDKIILDSYDKEKECFFVKRNVNGYFIVFECYEADDERFYSMEIK